MASVWTNDGDEWRLLPAEGFSDEQRLHELVEEAPHLLPLAGAPQLTIVGREVQLGSGYADLLAVESTGRLAVIEVKLARNAEARRAIVAQVLAYAAYLHQTEVEALETQVLARHLEARGYESLLDAAEKNDQEGSVAPAEFRANLGSSLAEGRFRLVLVLDEAPLELVRMVGYLEAVADRLLIDLISVAAYRVGETRILLPQRVDAEPTRQSSPRSAAPPAAKGRLVEGADDFEAACEAAPAAVRDEFRRYIEWARQLESDGLVRLSTYHGIADRLTLLPRLPSEGVGLVTIWNDHGTPYLQLWRSVIERTAPALVARIEQAIAPAELKQGNTVRGADADALELLAEAYRAAAAHA